MDGEPAHQEPAGHDSHPRRRIPRYRLNQLPLVCLDAGRELFLRDLTPVAVRPTART